MKQEWSSKALTILFGIISLVTSLLIYTSKVITEYQLYGAIAAIVIIVLIILSFDWIISKLKKIDEIERQLSYNNRLISIEKDIVAIKERLNIIKEFFKDNMRLLRDNLKPKKGNINPIDLLKIAVIIIFAFIILRMLGQLN